jgi:hypothetical protein
MSHRYGSRSLPTRIIAKEYDTMLKEIREHGHFDESEISFSYENSENNRNFDLKNLLEDCYELDMNEIPYRYKLKELDKLIPDYNEKDPQCDKIWKRIEKKLGNIFRTISKICFDKNKLTETEMTRYFVSVTEKEIFNGILNRKNLSTNVLCFMREIDDIEQNIGTNVKLAKRFIDLDSQNRVDQSSMSLLNDLKHKKIPAKLPDSNIFKFHVREISIFKCLVISTS